MTRLTATTAYLGVAKPDGALGDKHDKMNCRDENLTDTYAVETHFSDSVSFPEHSSFSTSLLLGPAADTTGLHHCDVQEGHPTTWCHEETIASPPLAAKSSQNPEPSPAKGEEQDRRQKEEASHSH